VFRLGANSLGWIQSTGEWVVGRYGVGWWCGVLALVDLFPVRLPRSTTDGGPIEACAVLVLSGVRFAKRAGYPLDSLVEVHPSGGPWD
jgi:hypothetical protein